MREKIALVTGGMGVLEQLSADSLENKVLSAAYIQALNRCAEAITAQGTHEFFSED